MNFSWGKWNILLFFSNVSYFYTLHPIIFILILQKVFWTKMMKMIIWYAWALSFTNLISCLLQIYPVITFKCGDEDLFYMAQRFPQKPDRLIFSCGFHKIFCSIWQNWIQLFAQNENTFNTQHWYLIETKVIETRSLDTASQQCISLMNSTIIRRVPIQVAQYLEQCCFWSPSCPSCSHRLASSVPRLCAFVKCIVTKRTFGEHWKN